MLLLFTMSSEETTSLLGVSNKLKLGQRGFRADWVYKVCPLYFPWSVFQIVEDMLSNTVAHEFLLLCIANSQEIADAVVRSDRVTLPGMHNTKPPRFKRIQAILGVMQPVVTELGSAPLQSDDIQGRIERYRTMVNKLATVVEEETATPVTLVTAASAPPVLLIIIIIVFLNVV